MLKIANKITMGADVTGICLPTKSYEEPNSHELIVVGWGRRKYQERTEMPEILQEVGLDHIDAVDCYKKYAKRHTTIYRSQFCTWSVEKDACQVK